MNSFKQVRVPEVVYRKVKLIALCKQIPFQQVYLDAVDAYISKLRTDDPVYNVLLHAAQFMTEDNGSTATADMFPESNTEVK